MNKRQHHKPKRDDEEQELGTIRMWGDVKGEIKQGYF